MDNMINENVREPWKNMTWSHTSFICKLMIPGLSITAYLFQGFRMWCLIAIPTLIKHKPNLDMKKL